MSWFNVNSSAIRSVGYDGSTLAIIFHSGRRYDLPGVPESVFHEFINSHSLGAYFNRYLRGRYG